MEREGWARSVSDLLPNFGSRSYRLSSEINSQFHPPKGTQFMATQFVINPAGERVSVIIPIAEYQSLLEAAAAEDETAFLLREPNGSILRQCLDDIRHGRNVQERELLSDED
ncbi:MAG: hypothetical protein LAE24_08590 [Candidatus Contendobacter sp.]|nr:hypothetical protein [Candidatus Contendobacter sp.]